MISKISAFASSFKSFSWSLEQFFLTVGQNNFGNKIPVSYLSCWWDKYIFFDGASSFPETTNRCRWCNSRSCDFQCTIFWKCRYNGLWFDTCNEKQGFELNQTYYRPPRFEKKNLRHYYSPSILCQNQWHLIAPFFSICMHNIFPCIQALHCTQNKNSKVFF